MEFSKSKPGFCKNHSKTNSLSLATRLELSSATPKPKLRNKPYLRKKVPKSQIPWCRKIPIARDFHPNSKRRSEYLIIGHSEIGSSYKCGVMVILLTRKLGRRPKEFENTMSRAVKLNLHLKFIRKCSGLYSNITPSIAPLEGKLTTMIIEQGFDSRISDSIDGALSILSASGREFLQHKLPRNYRKTITNSAGEPARFENGLEEILGGRVTSNFLRTAVNNIATSFAISFFRSPTLAEAFEQARTRN